MVCSGGVYRGGVESGGENRVNLKAKIFPLYLFCCKVAWFFLVYAFRLVYFFRVRKVRAKVRRGERVEVLFLAAVPSKWKCQSLFEAMRKSGEFHPVVAVSLLPREVFGDKSGENLEKTRNRVVEAVNFYERLGDECVLACNLETIAPVGVRHFRPDIVFYQEPGVLVGKDCVAHEGWHSLCCYVPYGLGGGNEDGNKKLRRLHWMPNFHMLMYLIVQWSPLQVRHSAKACHAWRRAGKVVGLGSPILDNLRVEEPDIVNNGFVIYAPHFSFPKPGIKRAITIGTFLNNGRKILEYAKGHKELKWVFKPHPNLRAALIEEAGWTEAEVVEYYSEWEAIGIGCYDGNYPPIFRQSKAMITDCASFLFEYPATGRPLIHLVLPEDKMDDTIAELHPLLRSYYRADNEKDMFSFFKIVLEEGLDPKRDERLALLKDAGIVGVNAAGNILGYLKRVLGVTS